MSEMEVYYFSARMRGEFIRLTLLASGQKFRDIRVADEEWTPEKKAEAPFGQMPYLVYRGKKYGQSVAIANFVAREFGLYGKTNLDGLRIDEVMQLAEDVKTRMTQDWYLAADDTKKAEGAKLLKEQTFPKFLGFFESLLNENGGTGFFVGNSVTLADLVVYDLVDSAFVYDPEAIATYPSVQKLRSNVEAVPAIKSYLHSTPRYEI